MVDQKAPDADRRAGKRLRPYTDLSASYGFAVKPPDVSDLVWRMGLWANRGPSEALRVSVMSRAHMVASGTASTADLIDLSVQLGEDRDKATTRILNDEMAAERRRSMRT